MIIPQNHFSQVAKTTCVGTHSTTGIRIHLNELLKGKTILNIYLSEMMLHLPKESHLHLTEHVDYHYR